MIVFGNFISCTVNGRDMYFTQCATAGMCYILLHRSTVEHNMLATIFTRISTTTFIIHFLSSSSTRLLMEGVLLLLPHLS